MSSFARYQVASADPFDRGRQLGTVAATQIHGSIDAYSGIFGFTTGLEWDDARRAARAYRDPIAEYDADILAEMEGLAAGARVGIDDILAINARTEIMFGLSAPASECTSFFAGPSTTVDGHTLVGQNWDWRFRCAPNTILAEVSQEGAGPTFVMMAEAGLIGKLGFNEAGIGVAANALVADIDHGEPGVPFHVVLRGILNSATVEEALSAIVRAKRAASANYVIASSDGRCLDVEAGPGGVENVFLVQPDAGLLAHANAYTAATPFLDAGKWPDSANRQQRVRDHLEAGRGRITPEYIEEILRDHDGRPTSVCRHPRENVDEMELGATLGSWIIDLTTLTAQLAEGSPCESEYHTFVPAFSASRTTASV